MRTTMADHGTKLLFIPLLPVDTQIFLNVPMRMAVHEMQGVILHQLKFCALMSWLVGPGDEH
jgi:hypothetical protein